MILRFDKYGQEHSGTEATPPKKANNSLTSKEKQLSTCVPELESYLCICNDNFWDISQNY